MSLADHSNHQPQGDGFDGSQTRSHGLQMGDALTAATALEHGIPLLTGNVQHFVPIASLHVEGFAS